MADWLHDELIASGKLPLVLCLVAFLVTFAITRLSTRMIRAGRGPFKDQVTDSGVHVHHAVPGIVLLSVGAVGSVATSALAWRSVSAILVGVGMSLVLDEFALILHLEDVYWANEGRLSVAVVSATMAMLALMVAGATPLGVGDVAATEEASRTGAAVGIGLNALLVLVCVLKGKLRVAIIGVLIPLVSLVAAIRLARPGSWWAKRFYGEKRQARAAARAARSDARWRARWRRWNELVGGKPDPQDDTRP